MTGSSSDGLLALWLHPLLITVNTGSTALLLIYTMYSYFTLIFSVYFHSSSLSASWQRIYNTGTIKVSLNYTLPIPLHYSTHKIFKSHFKSSLVDELFVAVSYRELRTENWTVEQSRAEQKLTAGNQPARSLLASGPGGTSGHIFDWTVAPFVFKITPLHGPHGKQPLLLKHVYRTIA
jgi:hypothetical protein